MAWKMAMGTQQQEEPMKPEFYIERGGRGMTYSRAEGFTVYEISEYEESSVLAGQQRRRFMDTFDTVEEAQRAYPEATLIEGTTYRPPFLRHLSNKGDE